ncbi:MAG: hypothetical protein KC415_05165 [Anaerolineales bacterium]|nr:hypothetical protein [Anaerolineales bacterium]
MPGNYIAYLLRLWREEPGDWRCMLENTRTGERRYFANLEQLLAFVQNQVREQDQALPQQEP